MLSYHTLSELGALKGASRHGFTNTSVSASPGEETALSVHAVPSPQYSVDRANSAEWISFLDALQPKRAFDGPPSEEPAYLQKIASLYDEAATPAAKSAAIGDWLLTLNTFKSCAPHHLRVCQIADGKGNFQLGCRNYGIFAADSDQTGSYIVKISNRPYEPIALLTLRLTPPCQPDIWAEHARASGMALTEEDLTCFPRIVPLLEWQQIYRREGEQNANGSPVDFRPLMLFSRAKGRHLFPPALDSQKPTPKAIDSELKLASASGFSLSLLHLPYLRDIGKSVFAQKSWKHGDLHASNLFFDAKHHRLELIDCIELEFKDGWVEDLRIFLGTAPATVPTTSYYAMWRSAFASGYMSKAPAFAKAELECFFLEYFDLASPASH